jgi:hypothetical protein
MAKKSKKKLRRSWSEIEIRELKAYSKARIPVKTISKRTKRTVGALRQKAFALGIGLGHER